MQAKKGIFSMLVTTLALAAVSEAVAQNDTVINGDFFVPDLPLTVQNEDRVCFDALLGQLTRCTPPDPGPQGPEGPPGPQGPEGPEGPAGMGVPEGNAQGDILEWDGSNWVAVRPPNIPTIQSSSNMPPYLGVHYIIALQGIFPSRSSIANPTIAEIMMFGGNFAPRSWAFCDGQLLPIASNSALFSILGTTYGGDGRTSFALPDLRGRVALHPGRGPGLTPRTHGERGGTETHTHQQF
ncbi:MAG: tail fiber protein [Xanthomonadales bacterium]|jgi:microcystin-dependent protein|nr:tail fiber protein [Xanthomonadales bacterium]